MGLGKTVEVLACILNNPGPSETKIELCEEMPKSDCPGYSPGSSGSNEKDALVKYPDHAKANSKQASLNKSKTVSANERQKQSFQLPWNEKIQLPKKIDDAGVRSLQSSPPSTAMVNLVNIDSNNFTQTVTGQSNLQLETDEQHQVGEPIKRCLPLDSHENEERFGKKARTEVSTVQCSDSAILNATGDQEKMGEIQEVIEKEKPVRCICGKNKAGPQEEILTCINCSLSQHPQCVGLTEVTDENYVCPDCSVKMVSDWNLCFNCGMCTLYGEVVWRGVWNFVFLSGAVCQVIFNQ